VDEYLNIDEVVFGHPRAQQELDDLRAEVDWLTARLSAIQAVVDAQAKDDGLWFIAATAPEAYL